ncbi:MAG: hypothetical protein AAFQ42_11975 [Pseudomonadota bacterium]
MLRLLSLAIILGAPAIALALVGGHAFSNAVGAVDHPIQHVFFGLPREAGWAGPVVALAGVAGSFMLLRAIGYTLSLITGVTALAMIFVVFVRPDAIDPLKRLIAPASPADSSASFNVAPPRASGTSRSPTAEAE